MWVIDVLDFERKTTVSRYRYCFFGPICKIGRLPLSPGAKAKDYSNITLHLNFTEDRSISRQHAEIHLISEDNSIAIVDLGSKFGTHDISDSSNPVTIPANEVTKLIGKSTYDIKFGAINSIIRIFQWELRICTTKIDPPTKAAIKRECKAIGAVVVDSAADATHIVSEKMTGTVKFLLGFVLKKPIVNSSWLKFADAGLASTGVPIAAIPLNLEEYLPGISDDVTIKDFQSSRSIICQHLIVFTRHANDDYASLITACGGQVYAMHDVGNQQLLDKINGLSTSSSNNYKICIFFDETHGDPPEAFLSASLNFHRPIYWLRGHQLAAAIANLTSPELSLDAPSVAWKGKCREQRGSSQMLASQYSFSLNILSDPSSSNCTEGFKFSMDASQLLSPPTLPVLTANRGRDHQIVGTSKGLHKPPAAAAVNSMPVDEVHNFEFNSLFQEDDKFVTSFSSSSSSSVLVSVASSSLHGGNIPLDLRVLQDKDLLLVPLMSPAVDRIALQVNNNSSSSSSTPLVAAVIGAEGIGKAKPLVVESKRIRVDEEEGKDRSQSNTAKSIINENSKQRSPQSINENLRGRRIRDNEMIREDISSRADSVIDEGFIGEEEDWVDNLPQKQRKTNHDEISSLTFGKQPQAGAMDKQKASKGRKTMSNSEAAMGALGDVEEILFKEPWVIERSLLSDVDNNSNSSSSNKKNSLGSLDFYYKPKYRNFNRRQANDDEDAATTGGVQDVRRFRKNYFTRAPQYELIRNDLMEKVLPKETEREIQLRLNEEAGRKKFRAAEALYRM